MNCFDCAATGITTVAVAVCSDCGAGLCADHVQVEAHWLTRTAVIEPHGRRRAPGAHDPLPGVPGGPQRCE